MIKQIEIKEPKIFDRSIIKSGITLKNTNYKPPIGFSISKADVFTDNEIEENRLEFAKFLKIERTNLIVQKQIHSDISNVVDKGFPICESDALITDKKGVCLVVSLADCCGILIFDKTKKVISAIHSGWKGSAQNIVGKTIKKIITRFSSNPSDFAVWITPCAGKEDYEIGQEVAELFPLFTTQKANGKFLLDLKSAIKQQLLDEGILENNIEISTESTISDIRFHSYRRDKKLSGRMAAFIMMQ